MTLEQTRVPAAAGDAGEEVTIRDRAFTYLRDLAFEVLLAAPEPMKTVDVARAILDQNDLKIGTSEEAVGNFAALVRMALDGDPAFLHAQRQWDLVARQSRPDADRRRPVERAIEDALEMIGRPARPETVAPFISATYGREPEYYQSMLERLAPTRPQFFRSSSGTVGLTRWLLDTSSDDVEDVIFDNFEDTAELEQFRRAVAEVEPAEDPVSYARALIASAHGPAPNKPLAFVVWTQFQDLEALALFNDLAAHPEVRMARGPAWVTEESQAELRDAIRDLMNDPELAASISAAAAPVVEEEAPAAAPVVQVGDADLEQVYDFMSNDLRSYRVSELCQEVLESFPGSRTFPAIREALLERMRADDRFVWMGNERFRLDGTLPDGIDDLPPGLAFDDREYLGEDEESVDKLLPVDRWKFRVEEQVLDPRVQEVGDDETEAAGSPPATVRGSVPLHHYIAGTLYVPRAFDGFFPAEPDLVELVVVTPDGERREAWWNNHLRLLFGLKEWYDANLPWTGGAFTLQPASSADEYTLLYSGETEPEMLLPTERLQTLLMLRSTAEAEAMPLTEVLTRVLKGQSQGVSFIRLFTEVNIVRRVRRALVASVLSGHRGFQQRPDQPGLWFYDEKRAEKGSRKGARPKRIREYDLDDEELEP